MQGALPAIVEGGGPMDQDETGRPRALDRFLGAVSALVQAHAAAGRTVAVLALAVALASALRRAHRIERENARLRRLVLLDSLTGLANRRAYDAGLEREWRRAMRHGTPLSLLLIDIDHFKRYNDGSGHAAGDDGLRRVAAVVGALTRRPGDLAARYGGEEFAILAAETSGAQATRLAEAVRARVEGLGITHAGADGARCVTVSVGVATAAPGRGETPAGLLAAADRALYAAKRAGRNRVRPVPGGAAHRPESALPTSSPRLLPSP